MGRRGITWSAMGGKEDSRPRCDHGRPSWSVSSIRLLNILLVFASKLSGFLVGRTAFAFCSAHGASLQRGKMPGGKNAGEKCGGKMPGEKCQTACKPGSVRPRGFLRGRRDGHSSRTRLAARLVRPTRAAGRERPWRLAPPAAPIRSCSRWGLPCHARCRTRGALLPHHFTLADSARLAVPAVCFLWHFPWGRPRRRLAGTVFPWSPDFPPARAAKRAPAAVRPSGGAEMRPRRGFVNRVSGGGRLPAAAGGR